MKLRRIAVLLVAFASVASSALSKDLSWPIIIGEDERQRVDSSQEPWRAVGRLAYADYNRYGHCTGSLVAPRLVLTAAHCLFNPYTYERLPLKNYHFVAGMMRSDKFLDHAKAACAYILPGFGMAEHLDPDSMRADAAVIVLDKALKVTPLPIAEDNALKPDTEVAHAGYGRDRPFALSVHRDCRVFSTDGKAALTSCDSNLGQSGGPILLRDGETWKLAAIMSGGMEKLATGGPTSASWRSLLTKTTCGE